MEKTHFRKAFNSPYLSSADLTGPIQLTVDHVVLEPDKTHKTKDKFNTAYFVQKEIRPGEVLKPMILNAGNSHIMLEITGSPYIEDWLNVPVTVYVEKNVRLGADVVDGLRISKGRAKKTLTPDMEASWKSAKEAYLRDGGLEKILARVEMAPEHQAQLVAECNTPSDVA